MAQAPKTCEDCSLTWDRKHNVKDIVLCPLHASAPKLLEALEDMVDGFSPDLYAVGAAGHGRAGNAYIAYDNAHTAIREAKGE